MTQQLSFVPVSPEDVYLTILNKGEAIVHLDPDDVPSFQRGLARAKQEVKDKRRIACKQLELGKYRFSFAGRKALMEVPRG